MAFRSLYAFGVLALSLAVLFASYIINGDLIGFYYPHQMAVANPSEADVLIIGGSHAGLSAALTLVRHQIDVLIIDSNSPRNKWKTPSHTLPTWEGRTEDDLRRASRKELKRSGLVRFVETQISTVRKPVTEDGFFEVSDTQGQTWRGRKLLTSMGVDFMFPAIKGYEDVFPDRIAHCLFTRGLEYKGSRSAGLLAMGLAGIPLHAAMLVEDAQKFANEVVVYTNGDTKLGDDTHKVLEQRGTKDIKIINRRVTQLMKHPDSSEIMIELDDGSVEVESFLVHQPDTQANPDIVKQLGLETNARRDIVTKMPFYSTNVSGVFAAGDCASPFKMITNSMFQGSNAGAGIARELPRRVTGHDVNRK